MHFSLDYKLKWYQSGFFSVDLVGLLLLQTKNNKFCSLPEVTHWLMCLNTDMQYSFTARVRVEVAVALFRLSLSPFIILALMHWGVPRTTCLFFSIILAMKRSSAKQWWQPMRAFSDARGDKLEEETASRSFSKVFDSGLDPQRQKCNCFNFKHTSIWFQ